MKEYNAGNNYGVTFEPIDQLLDKVVLPDYVTDKSDYAVRYIEFDVRRLCRIDSDGTESKVQDFENKFQIAAFLTKTDRLRLEIRTNPMFR